MGLVVSGVGLPTRSVYAPAVSESQDRGLERVSK